MCGIMALLLADAEAKAAPEINEGLSLLQHRGQDAAGITTCKHGGQFFQCKANGMVRDVIDASSLSRLQGRMGIGHGESQSSDSVESAATRSFSRLASQHSVVRKQAMLVEAADERATSVIGKAVQ